MIWNIITLKEAFFCLNLLLTFEVHQKICIYIHNVSLISLRLKRGNLIILWLKSLHYSSITTILLKSHILKNILYRIMQLFVSGKSFNTFLPHEPEAVIVSVKMAPQLCAEQRMNYWCWAEIKPCRPFNSHLKRELPLKL